jgi:succinate dehydrogenase / fumarate reductase, flavoprotein subunit
VGGANGANRLSGNAITEALVFGRRAGRSAAERAASIAAQPFRPDAARVALDLIAADGGGDGPNTAEMITMLQATMADDVGPLRDAARLRHALARIDELAGALGDQPFGAPTVFDLRRLEWFDLRNMLLVARTVAATALAREESRGAHQREDFPDTEPAWRVNQTVRWRDGEIALARGPAAVEMAAQ